MREGTESKSTSWDPVALVALAAALLVLLGFGALLVYRGGLDPYVGGALFAVAVGASAALVTSGLYVHARSMERASAECRVPSDVVADADAPVSTIRSRPAAASFEALPPYREVFPSLREPAPSRETCLSLLPLYSEIADDPDIAEILVQFVGGLADSARRIERAAAANEPEILVRVVHQVKGAAGGFGFPSITRQAAVVEDGLRGGASLLELTPAIAALVRLCMAARVAEPVQQATG